MDALLGRSSLVRTVAVTFEPIAARALDARGRGGRSPAIAPTASCATGSGRPRRARQRQAQEAAMRREAELAAGHAEVRLAGFVTVTGRDRDESAARLRRGARAGGPGPARVAPDVRPAGRRVRVHAAAVPGAEVSRPVARPSRAPLHDPARPGHLPVRGQRRPGRPRRVHGTGFERRRLLLRPLGPLRRRRARRSERDRPRQARPGQERAGQDAAVADAAVRAPRVRARRQARVRTPVPGGRASGRSRSSPAAASA